MAKQAVEPAVEPEGKPESGALKFLKHAWVVLACWLALVSSVVVLFFPDRLGGWSTVLTILAGLDLGMGGAAFGGPAIKRAQENASYRDETAR